MWITGLPIDGTGKVKKESKVIALKENSIQKWKLGIRSWWTDISK